MTTAQDDYFVCPHCDARVPVDALACPECGSDDETGWSNATVGIGDEDAIPPRPLFSFLSRLSTRITKLGAQKRENELHQNLLRKCGGDEKLVERILQNEARRAPHEIRAQWLQTAIDKWERDNR